MVSNSTTREPYVDDEFGQPDPTAARPAPCEPLTGFNRSAWAARPGDDAQSATFRALAWSDDDDSIAEPANCAAGEPQPAPAPRYRRSALWYGIAAAVAGVAVGGLLFTVNQTPEIPTAIPVKVTQPAQNLVDAQPGGSTSSSVPPASAGGAPVRAALPVVPFETQVAPPRPAAVGPKPDSQQTSGAPEVVAPAPPAAEIPEPDVPEPGVPEPEVTTPPLILITSPVPSIPDLTPDLTLREIPRRAGPPVFRVPPAPAAGATPPVDAAPAAPVLPDSGVALPSILPTLAVDESR